MPKFNFLDIQIYTSLLLSSDIAYSPSGFSIIFIRIQFLFSSLYF